MYNYHTHTKRCGHANGEDKEYVLSAIKANFKGLGFSDHVMLPNLERCLIRANYKMIDDYFSSIKQLKEEFKDQIEIYTSFECEWDNHYQKFYKELLDSKKVDYLVFGNHGCYFKGNKEYFIKSHTGTPYLKRYLNNALKALRSNLFKIMAHPDIYTCYVPWNEKSKKVAEIICKEAKKNNIALELNCGCIINEKEKNIFNEKRYRYPYSEFWKIAKKVGNTIVVGIDAHSPSAFSSENLKYMQEFIKKLNLTITEKIDF